MKQMIRGAAFVSVMMPALAASAIAQDRVASFEMAWPTQRQETVAARAQAAAEAMTGQPVKRPATVVPSAQKSSSGRTRLRVAEAPALDIVYLPDVAELRIVNRELAASTAP